MKETRVKIKKLKAGSLRRETKLTNPQTNQEKNREESNQQNQK